MVETEDKLLVVRCLDGDREAFAELVVRYQRPIFNIALRMVGRYEDAQDIAQTVFLKAYESLGSFRPEYKLFSWLYRIAMNESVNFMSRHKPQELVDERHPSSDTSPERLVEAAEIGQNIEQALGMLSPEYKAVIILRHFEDLSYDEMARTLGIPEKTVKSRLFSARRVLCEILSKRGVTTHD